MNTSLIRFQKLLVQNAESVECLVVSTQTMNEQKTTGLLLFFDVQVNYPSEIPYLLLFCSLFWTLLSAVCGIPDGHRI
jgi:hypothetical protein